MKYISKSIEKQKKMATGYKHRVIDNLLKRKLKGIGAVLIEGPKLCGKTTTAEQAAKSVVYMTAPQDRKMNEELARVQPNVLLEGKTPRLIDEWQVAPQLWDAVRFEVDHRKKTGQFILTGSAVPADRSAIFHSGTGRFAWLRMRTMSLFESGESNGKVSLKTLFDGRFTGGQSELTYSDVAYLACRGGWPTALGQAQAIALERVTDYYDAVVNVDISRVDGVKRNIENTKLLMRSYAEKQGTQTPLTALREAMKANAGREVMSAKTLSGYLEALRQIFVIEDMPAWNPNLRSKTAIRTADTRYFSDPSLCAAALGIGPKDLEKNPETFGFVFETLCVRDLRVYADALDGTVYHYRDKTNLECDAVLHRRDGSYGLIEIKLGGDYAVEHGAETLKALAERIDVDKMMKPAFLMVLTAVGQFAFQREDGVYVVPIGCLKD